MNDEYNKTYQEIKDSGERRSFPTGSVRDTDDNKPKYSLIPVIIWKRLAQHYSNGAKKYAARNWQKGQYISVYYDSLMRHVTAIIENQDDEDHVAAAIWNVVAMGWTLAQIKAGNLPEELDDRKDML